MGCVQTKEKPPLSTISTVNGRAIKAVVFDYSEVLWLHSRNAHLYRLIEREMDIGEGSLMDTLTSSEFQKRIPRDFNHLFMIGRCTAQELDDIFTQAYNARYNTDIPFVQLYSHQKFDNDVVYEEIALNACLQLRKHGILTVLLMNTFHVDNSFQGRKLKVLQSYFDVIIESCLEGVRKPDPQIFKIMMKRISCRPQEIILLDDEQINCDSARNLGIKTILVSNTMDAIEELQDTLGIDLL